MKRTYSRMDMGKSSLLKDRYPHPRDSRIRFREEDHVYHVQYMGRKDWLQGESTSAMYKSYFGKFDADAVIQKMMNSKNWSSSFYFGMNPQQIKDYWNKNRDLGTDLHLCIENYYNRLPQDAKTLNTPSYEQFKQFSEVHELEPFRTEMILWTDVYHKVCGTIDMLFLSKNWKSVDKDGNNVLHLTMFDWKRSKQIRKWNRSRGIGICSDLMDTNLSHYSLQQNIYKYILERWYAPWTVKGVTFQKVVVDSMSLLVMHPTKKQAEKIVIEDLQEVVDRMFDEKRRNNSLSHLMKMCKTNNTKQLRLFIDRILDGRLCRLNMSLVHYSLTLQHWDCFKILMDRQGELEHIFMDEYVSMIESLTEEEHKHPHVQLFKSNVEDLKTF